MGRHRTGLAVAHFTVAFLPLEPFRNSDSCVPGSVEEEAAAVLWLEFRRENLLLWQRLPVGSKAALF